MILTGPPHLQSCKTCSFSPIQQLKDLVSAKVRLAPNFLLQRWQDERTNPKENNMNHQNSMQPNSQKLYRINQVLEVIPVSKTTWWNGVRDGRFPKPIRNGRMTFWKSGDIDSFIDAPNPPDLSKLEPKSK